MDSQSPNQFTVFWSWQDDSDEVKVTSGSGIIVMTLWS